MKKSCTMIKYQNWFWYDKIKWIRVEKLNKIDNRIDKYHWKKNLVRNDCKIIFKNFFVKFLCHQIKNSFNVSRIIIRISIEWFQIIVLSLFCWIWQIVSLVIVYWELMRDHIAKRDYYFFRNKYTRIKRHHITKNRFKICQID